MDSLDKIMQDVSLMLWKCYRKTGILIAKRYTGF